VGKNASMIAPVTRKARKLRNTSTETEQRLWHYLRGKAVAGAKFRRQYPFGPYITDFACPELKLIVEADGGQHQGSEHDNRRDTYCKAQGYVVLRYWDDQILRETEAVLEDIYRWVVMLQRSPSQPPPPVGEEQNQSPPVGQGQERKPGVGKAQK
jgi:very-short-patch-repair endonuclease